VIQVARGLPAIQFSIVGLRAGQRLDVPSNVSLHGWASNLDKFYRDSTVLWRPTRHDGLSFMALEALAYGRYVLWTYPFTGAIQTQDPIKARNHIEAMFELHHSGRLPLNRAGAEYVGANFSRAQIRRSLLERWRGIVHPAVGSAAPALGLATEIRTQSASRSSTASS
jgi:glycosyltransferase involved in cell wall biosynthesis